MLFVDLRVHARTSRRVWVPVLLLIQLAFTIGLTLVLSSTVVYLRDLRQLLPDGAAAGLFATPVAYSLDVIPTNWWPTVRALNPLAPVIDGYRRTVLLRRRNRDFDLVGIAAVTSVVTLVAGYLAFKQLETGFADVA